ncbi:MAG: HNH endonuclease [Candidatus Hydrothermales bacterium]
MILLILNKAESVVNRDGKKIRSCYLEINVPSVIRIKRYVNYRPKEVPINKRNIIKRDKSTCQYCGKKSNDMTIDHVIPKDKGGKDTWENLVTCCKDCNMKKANRTPKEAGMKLIKKPKKPNYFHILFSEEEIPDENWKPFLFI